MSSSAEGPSPLSRGSGAARDALAPPTSPSPAGAGDGGGLGGGKGLQGAALGLRAALLRAVGASGEVTACGGTDFLGRLVNGDLARAPPLTEEHAVRLATSDRAQAASQQQAEVVAHVRGGGDALVLWPTGGGKSLCYQLPGLEWGPVTLGTPPPLVVVFSPLIALMADQVNVLNRGGRVAAALGGADEPGAAFTCEAVLGGALSLVFLSPEVARWFVPLVAAVPWVVVQLLVIDEAHVVLEWGDDFRTSYAPREPLPREPAVNADDGAVGNGAAARSAAACRRVRPARRRPA